MLLTKNLGRVSVSESPRCTIKRQGHSPIALFYHDMCDRLPDSVDPGRSGLLERWFLVNNQDLAAGSRAVSDLQDQMVGLFHRDRRVLVHLCRLLLAVLHAHRTF